jgi:hypothetical protein
MHDYREEAEWLKQRVVGVQPEAFLCHVVLKGEHQIKLVKNLALR